VILVLYVVAHMIGNLKVYLGAGPLNDYADFLRRMGEPVFPRSLVLWCLRAVVIAAFAVHIVTAVQLSLQSRAARRVRYVHPDRVQADPASTTMRWGGVAVALFVVFHLAHFTWGWVHPGYTFVRGDVYQNVVQGFNVWWITAIYLAAMVALALHIYHGTWSIFQTFGVDNLRWNLVVRRLAAFVAAIVFIGNCSIPIAVIAGAVK
jgi:succinate dehydrogenase / fumarate reductase cytochrome b subunit